MDRIHDVDNLLQTGINLMVASGYHNTSINDIIREAGLPKGSFYYLYKDKKAFALDAVRRYVDELVNDMAGVFSRESSTPLQAIKEFYLESIQSMDAVGFAHGCFLGNVGQEMSDVDPDFRKVVKEGFDRVHDQLSVQLSKAKEAGELAPNADVDVIADLFINTWHGSLLRMKASKSRKPLEIFINEFFSFVSCNV